MHRNAAGADGLTLEADVCIIGAGPAGLVLADALTRQGKEVIVLESGGAEPDSEVQELNIGETDGDYPQLERCRFRGIGGTAALWNTMFEGSRFAKYVPLDPIDFDARDWIPWSGWPSGVVRALSESYYELAHAVCGLGPFDYRAGTWSDGSGPPLGFGASGLVQSVYQFGAAERLTRILPERVAAAPTAQMVRGATLTELVANRSRETITEARWVTLSGTTGTTRARAFVLAAGALENARILLLHRQAARPAPVADWLGRGFMEHPIDASLQLVSRAPALAARPGSYLARVHASGIPVLGRIGFAAELLRAERMPNASMRILRDFEALEPASEVREAARRLVPFRRLRAPLGNAVRAVLRRRTPRYRVLIELEQAPHPENRVLLSDRRDRLGQPRARLQWRWRPEDEVHRERICALAGRELARAARGRIERDAGHGLDPAAHHHAGTTRMHTDRTQGVVDANLRVWEWENLYVSGASVFPTAGVANPTLTIVALSLRLGDHLVQEAVKR